MIHLPIRRRLGKILNKRKIIKNSGGIILQKYDVPEMDNKFITSAGIYSYYSLY